MSELASVPRNPNFSTKCASETRKLKFRDKNVREMCFATKYGREALVPKKEALVPQKEALVPQREALVPHKEALVPQKAALVPLKEYFAFNSRDLCLAQSFCASER